MHLVYHCYYRCPKLNKKLNKCTKINKLGVYLYVDKITYLLCYDHIRLNN